MNAHFTTALIALSVALNITVTTLIAGRLIHARIRFAKLLGESAVAAPNPSSMTSGGRRSGDDRKYSGIVGANAILLESAVPLAVLGIAYIIASRIAAAGSTGRPSEFAPKAVAEGVISILYYAFVVSRVHKISLKRTD